MPCKYLICLPCCFCPTQGIVTIILSLVTQPHNYLPLLYWSYIHPASTLYLFLYLPQLSCIRPRVPPLYSSNFVLPPERPGLCLNGKPRAPKCINCTKNQKETVGTMMRTSTQVSIFTRSVYKEQPISNPNYFQSCYGLMFRELGHGEWFRFSNSREIISADVTMYGAVEHWCCTGTALRLSWMVKVHVKIRRHKITSCQIHQRHLTLQHVYLTFLH